jgi:glutamate synthase domain-containing protein 2
MEIINYLTQLQWWVWILIVLIIVGIRDIFFNKYHSISHNFPIIGHFRFILEKIGPELRQYIVANNREELPFNRSERSWIYASSKKENNYKGFGTDQDFHAPNYFFIKPDLFPYKMDNSNPNYSHPDFLPCAKVMGEYNKRKRPFRPRSIVNVSAMSYGSLSKRAISSLNIGALKTGCYHNTGEGGLSPYHAHGADVIFQIGTGYFGVRNDDGSLSLDKLDKLVENNHFVRAIEIKLSQGAKPGKGGVLPAAKITKEIADIRGVPLGKDVISPSYHTAFSNVDEMLDLIEIIAERTGLPVGIKAAIGKIELWDLLGEKMIERNTGPDFITIDGGEGGTGAAPPSFSDHVALPFYYAFGNIYQLFAQKGLTDRIVFIGSSKLGLPASAIKALAMGADLINVAREAMMSIGCIQSQVCHTNRCPSGVATQNSWLQMGINIPLKSDRFSDYAQYFRKEMVELTHAAGYEHPCQFTMDDIELSMGDNNHTRSLHRIYRYKKVPVAFSGMADLFDCEHLGADKGVFDEN